jgi:diguanylate cyclase (GGDEF)-like protein/PAS domain S-box-containing protein
MLSHLDFETLLVTLAMARVLQSLGLVFVWKLHQHYRPARDWAIGSAIMAAGTLGIATRNVMTHDIATAVSFVSAAAILFGALTFNSGILRASAISQPIGLGRGIALIATLLFGWFSYVDPSAANRMAAFGAAMMLFDLYTAARLLAVKRKALSALLRVIGVILLIDAASFPLRITSVYVSGNIIPEFSIGSSLAVIFAIIATAGVLMMTLALTALTSLIDLTERQKLQEQLNRSERYVRAILESASDVAIIAAERDLLITVFNTGAERMLGYTADEVVGRCNPTIFADPEEAAARSRELSAEFGRPIKGLGLIIDPAVIGQNRRWTWVRKDGSRLPVSMTVSAMRGEDGEIIGYLGVAHDISKQLAYESALQNEIAKSEAVSHTLETALSNMRQGLAMFDQQQRVIVLNDNFMAPFGLSKADAPPGTTFREIVQMRIANGFFSVEGPEAYLKSRIEVAASMQSADHDDVVQLNNGRFIRSISRHFGNGDVVITSEDITEIKRNQARISYLAQHDALTGLSNRAHFNEQIEQASAALAGSAQPFTVLMIDLDRFKAINDTLGHAAGDLLLKEVAAAIEGATRPTDLVARLGGDEFAIIQIGDAGVAPTDGEAQRRAARALAERILTLLAKPIDLFGKTVQAGASIGIALAPADGCKPDELLRKADYALYAAKEAGRNAYRLFAPEMMATFHERDSLESALRAALSHDEFTLHYQPIVDTGSGEIVCIEALVRWQHPTQGLLSPHQFLPVAEETGLIVPLGGWVIRRACRDATRWPVEVPVAVNLSAAQLASPELIDTITSALQASGLAPHRLEIEITEAVLLDDGKAALATLQKIRDLGASVSLDDFGTGYSSLTQLKAFKFRRIKIDRSFIEDIACEADSLAIVSALAGLARGLNMTCSAEGVETEEQRALLRAAGVSFAQGDLFGRPCPAAELRFARQMAAVRSA